MSFKASLRMGALGETIYYEANCAHLEKLDGKKGDFRDKDTDEVVELKSDLYDMRKTACFFFERYSDSDKKTPGGPWQAAANGAAQFVYLFVPNLTYFTFRTAELVASLEVIIPHLEPVNVQNVRWTTVGYRVPREALEHISSHVKLKVAKDG